MFGGGTCNTEFEFLTGMTMKFLPPGVSVYQTMVVNPLESLATTMREQGYQSIAFHPGKPTSWRRNVVMILNGHIKQKQRLIPFFLKQLNHRSIIAFIGYKCVAHILRGFHILLCKKSLSKGIRLNYRKGQTSLSL